MIEKFDNGLRNSVDKCGSDLELEFLDKINEMVEVMNQMRSDINELMNDLFYRETLNIEKNEK